VLAENRGVKEELGSDCKGVRTFVTGEESEGVSEERWVRRGLVAGEFKGIL
jgi:hypothetical protein